MSHVTHCVRGLAAPGGSETWGDREADVAFIVPACSGVCPFSPRLPLHAEE